MRQSHDYQKNYQHLKQNFCIEGATAEDDRSNSFEDSFNKQRVSITQYSSKALSDLQSVQNYAAANQSTKQSNYNNINYR